MFKTPGFAQSDDIYRRVVLLITDGQANRSDNPQYPGVYAAPGDTDAQFFPDVGGDPWKYFLYLKQTMPTLVGEVSNRSATFEEIILASQRGQEISNKLKAPGDGNTLLFGLGIDINAQNPGPYTRQNVLDLMRSWVSAPSFFRESNTSDPDSQIAETLARLVQDIFQLSAGSRLVVHDRINTALFRYVPGSIRISGVRDGLLLKSPNQPDIIDPSDPNYTVYPKAPLLPDVDDNTFVDGGFVLDLGTMPLGLLTQDSRTSVTITYEIESNRLANGDHLHTNTDDQTYAAFTEPNHLEASTSAIDYSAPVRNLLFHTPIVACSCAPTPGLSVEKFVDRTSAAPGDRVNYTIIVHNTGTLRLVNVRVTDARLGLDFTIPAIEPLTSYTESVAYTIPPGTPPGALVNTVFASNELFPDPLNASAVVNVSESPSLVLTKSVDKRQARPGETVVFTITVTNNGNVPIENARFVDELLGISTTIESIAAGATLSADLPYVIPDDAAIGSTIVNVAVLTTAELPPLTAAVSVEVLAQPRLSLTKTVDRKQTAPGTTIQFTLTVTNTGSMPLTNVRVSDPTLALDTTIPSLLPGESVVIPQPFNVPLETPPTVYTNTVTATSDQTTPVTATEQVEVLAQPALGIRKVVDRPTASHGEAVQYTIQVANFGNVPLVGIRLTDEVLGVDLQIEGLEIGEIWTREFSYTVPSTAVIGSRIVNRATASNSATGTVEATATITVVGTGLSIAKTVSPAFGAPGEIVTYTLTVTNLLNVAQTNVVLTDTLLGLNETVPVLGPGQSIVRNVPFVLPDVPEGTVLPNVFSSASDQSGVQSTEAKVLVQRELTDAALRVTKSASANLAPLGSLIEYTVTVTNVGAGAATNIDVRDSLTGTAAFIPFLAPGASETVVFFCAIPDSLPGSPIVTNRVVATSPQTNPASAEASVRVGIPHHLLHLTNVVDKPVVPPGTTVHFTFTVTNQSPFILHDVRVFGEITGFETIIPVLLPGESRAFVVPFVVPTDAISGMVFVETASAFSLETPFQQAPASVIPVVNADFTLSETVDKPVVPPQTRVHFTIQTTNVGNADLINFRVFASLLSLRVRVVRFPIGATLRGRFPFDTPDTDEEIVIPSPVTAEADNAGPKRVEVSVRVIPEDEE